MVSAGDGASECAGRFVARRCGLAESLDGYRTPGPLSWRGPHLSVEQQATLPHGGGQPRLVKSAIIRSEQTWPYESGFCGWVRSATPSTASSWLTRAPSATAVR